MTAIVYVLALLWIASGAFLIVFTEKTREFFKKIFLTDRVRRWSALPLIFGVILIIAAFCKRDMFWLALILGLLGIAKGIYLFAGPPEQTKAFMEWWLLKARPETVRFFGLISFVLGIAVLSYLG